MRSGLKARLLRLRRVILVVGIVVAIAAAVIYAARFSLYASWSDGVVVERAPAIVVRNPYTLVAPVLDLLSGVLVRYGYVVVLNEVRAQGRSEGPWEPIVHERQDGEALIAWVLAQDFHDKHLATLGMSYLGAAQWAFADAVPPEVKTMVPMVSAPDLHPTMYERGLFRHDVMMAWASLMPVRGMRVIRGGFDERCAVDHVPTVDVDEACFGERLPWYRTWLSSPSIDAAIVARMILEMPDAAPVLVREGAATPRCPTSETCIAASPPGTPVDVVIELWPMEWAVPAGARLRVELSSSSSPALHTHTNTDQPWAQATTAQDAALTVTGSPSTFPSWSDAWR